MKYNNSNKNLKSLLIIFISLILFLTGCTAQSNQSSDSSSYNKSSETKSSNNTDSSNSKSSKNTEDITSEENKSTTVNDQAQVSASFNYAEVPAYSGNAYAVINGNDPYFTSLTTDEFETYSDLDGLGRCQTAFANISQKTMPTESRTSIGMIKPSGWHLYKYDCVDGKYLYNRCHLIAFELAGENANEKNLITGTRYLNINGMLPFENQIHDYVKETNNHVMYRVTPIFVNNDLLAAGVLMEAESVEDNGASIKFCVFCYNVQPNVSINYNTGESSSTCTGTTTASNTATAASGDTAVQNYVLNTNTHKFHKPGCYALNRTKDSNKQAVTATRTDLINQGYEPCKICNP